MRRSSFLCLLLAVAVPARAFADSSPAASDYSRPTVADLAPRPLADVLPAPLPKESAGSSSQIDAVWVYGVGLDEPVRMDVHSGHETTSLYYTQNAIGSVVALADRFGRIVERYRYLAFGKEEVLGPEGEVRSGTAYGNPWRFQGRWKDGETGLLQYRSRYYDPEQGRFLTRDLLGVWGSSRQLGNGYGSFGNCPLTRRDPFGLDDMFAGFSNEQLQAVGPPSGWTGPGGQGPSDAQAMAIHGMQNPTPTGSDGGGVAMDSGALQSQDVPLPSGMQTGGGWISSAAFGFYSAVEYLSNQEQVLRDVVGFFGPRVDWTTAQGPSAQTDPTVAWSQGAQVSRTNALNGFAQGAGAGGQMAVSYSVNMMTVFLVLRGGGQGGGIGGSGCSSALEDAKTYLQKAEQLSQKAADLRQIAREFADVNITRAVEIGAEAAKLEGEAARLVNEGRRLAGEAGFVVLEGGK